MHEGVLHIRDVEGPKKAGSMETRLEAMEKQVFKFQGMLEQGLNANHMMIAEFTHKYNLDTKDLWGHIFKIYENIEHLQAQIYDLQKQNVEYEYRFKKMSLAGGLRISKTSSSFYDGKHPLMASTTQGHF
ncbi:40S ribosomal protein S5-1 [Hordeum vulgare]|nr:40S ribosomal protein S5-1 [Hordeum vulgare]